MTKSCRHSGISSNHGAYQGQLTIFIIYPQISHKEISQCAPLRNLLLQIPETSMSKAEARLAPELSRCTFNQ